MSTILSLLSVVAASTGLLVSPAELAAALTDPAVVVVTIAERPSDFEAGHIPGARFVRYGDVAPDRDGLASELPPVERLREVLAAVGINESSKVVIYGSPVPASRLFFTLDYLGHPSVRILNGGMAAWLAGGGAVETGPGPRVEPVASSLGASLRPDCVVDAEWIVERTADRKPQTGERPPAITLVDARPDDEFTGADRGRNGTFVAGHLPGAQQLAWSTLVDRTTGIFLPDAELRTRFEAAGASAGTPLVSYCMIGMRASVTYFLARHLGYDARMYDGSIQDWTNKRLPAQTGR